MRQRIRDSIVHIGRNPYVILFALALVVRLVYLFMVVNRVGVEHLSLLDEDIENYYRAAIAIRDGFEFQTKGVLIFGPGYPVLLAILMVPVGINPVALLLFQIVLGALGAVLMAMLAVRWTEHRAVGLVAGGLVALLPISISLATKLRSDVPYMVLTIAGLLLFDRAIRSSKAVSYILAVLLLTGAALTRSMGQFMFVMLFVMVLVRAPRSGRSSPASVVRRLKWPLLSTLLMVLLLGLWIHRNEQVYGFRYLALAGPDSFLKMAALVSADLEGKSYEDALGAYLVTVDSCMDAHESDAMYTSRVMCKRDLFLSLASAHPFTTAKVILANASRNSNSAWGWHFTVLAIIGAVLVYRERKRGLLLVLLCLWGYFAFFSGFTVQQGQRIFYPGLISWSILIAYALVFGYRAVRSRFARG